MKNPARGSGYHEKITERGTFKTCLFFRQLALEDHGVEIELTEVTVEFVDWDLWHAPTRAHRQDLFAMRHVRL